VKKISATQTRAKPASRAGGIGSCRISTPTASWKIGAMYCRMPIPTIGTRLAVAANSSSGTAVATPDRIISTVCPVETVPKCASPLAASQTTKPRAGSASTEDSTNRPSAGGSARRFLTRLYVPKLAARISAMYGSRP
jgi:hypothetical protein